MSLCLSNELQQRAKPNLTYEQSQRLMALVELRKEICGRLDKLAKDFRALLEELKRVQRQIKGIGGGYRAARAWTVTPEFRFNWKAIAVALVLFVASAFAQFPHTNAVLEVIPNETTYRISWDAAADPDRTGWRLTWSTTTNEISAGQSPLLNATNRQYLVILPTATYWFFLRPVAADPLLNTLAPVRRAGITPTNYVAFDYRDKGVTNPPVRVYAVQSSGKGGFLSAKEFRQFQQIP